MNSCENRPGRVEVQGRVPGYCAHSEPQGQHRDGHGDSEEPGEGLDLEAKNEALADGVKGFRKTNFSVEVRVGGRAGVG